VARENNQISVFGYICFWPVADEIQLLNLAVRPDCRHKKVGRRLMGFLLQQAREKKMQKIFLEVRPSNRIALDLYYSLGFKILYRRPGYYRHEGEDALVMVRSAGEEEGASLK
jgi:[ribosomal protein S18]-alanine N-acetyltransferase